MENYENIDIKRIFEIALSKIVLIFLILILCLTIGYGYSFYYKTPEYSSSVTILLAGDESESEAQEVTQTDLSINSGLISTYCNIATSSSIVEKSIQNLGLNISVQELQNNITAKQVSSTQFLKISVTSTNPEEACNIANELAKVFTEEIKEIYNIQNINVVDNAEVATSPYNINHKKDLLIAGAIGMFLSAILVMAIYILDDTIKDEKDLEKNLRLKTLGTLPIDKEKEGLIIENNPKSHIVECIKTLRTNILYTTNKNSILFTSFGQHEGKSWVINNLSIAFAQANKKVILVDANLRAESEKIEKFKIKKGEGLSDFIKEITDNKLENLEKSKKYIQESNVPNLHILQSGTIPPNPLALISSENMKQLLSLLKSMYDVVLIDGISCMEVSDSIALSSMVDSTIIVAENKKTKLSDLKKVKKSIEDVNGYILGVILNKARVKKGKYYGKKYGYGYGYYYGRHNDEIGRIEEKQKAITLEQLIETARENIKNELENKKEDIIETEVTELNDTSYIESLNQINNELNELKVIQEKGTAKYVNKIKDLNKKIDTINYEEKMKNIVEQFMGQVDELNEEIKNLRRQQDSSNYEMMGTIYNIELTNLEQKAELIEKINKLELNRENQKTEILTQINKLEEARAKQNEIIMEKLEKIEANNNKMAEMAIEQQDVKEEKQNNIISFEELRERSKKLRKRTFDINESIQFEDLKELSPFIIDLNETSLSNVASK